MSEILYNFSANADYIDGFQTSLGDVTQVKEDITKIFNALKTAYEGQGADALEASHQALNRTLDDALYDSQNTQKLAADQQEAMQALDRANAASF